MAFFRQHFASTFTKHMVDGVAAVTETTHIFHQPQQGNIQTAKEVNRLARVCHGHLLRRCHHQHTI